MNINVEEVEALCEAITSSFILEDRNSADYCMHCGMHYGNVQKFIWDKRREEPHDDDCPVVIARKILRDVYSEDT